MKILIQIAIVFSLCLAGEAISTLIPFPVPASIIALILLLILLLTGVIKVDHIKEKSDFLLSNMAFFFVPAGVKVIEHFDTVKSVWLAIVVIGIVTTVIVFIVTALTVKLVLKVTGGKK